MYDAPPHSISQETLRVFRLILFFLDSRTDRQLAQLLVVYRRRCIGHYIAGTLILRERNDITNRVGTGQKGSNPIPTERDSPVRRRAELEGINDTWKTRVQGMQETLDTRKKLIDELQAARGALDAELTTTRSQLRDAQAQLGEEQQQVLMRYMAYGGSIAGAGLLLGLVSVPLPGGGSMTPTLASGGRARCAALGCPIRPMRPSAVIWRNFSASMQAGGCPIPCCSTAACSTPMPWCSV